MEAVADRVSPHAASGALQGNSPRVCIVGSGTRFLSGISYYTLCLANTLAPTHSLSVILMRQLVPTRVYPGRDRVGARLTNLSFDPRVDVFDGLDWHWTPSMVECLAFLRRARPEVLIFQWWSGTTLHSYLALAAAARALGARVVIEFHESLDTAEARLAPVRAYVERLAPILMSMADAFVVHSAYDRALITGQYGLGGRPVAIIPHGPYDHYRTASAPAPRELRPEGAPAPGSCINLLYFGVIRPYKGVEDLVAAFDAIPESEIDHYWLTIVGETWEGCTLPAELIAQSPYRDRITFVNRYVTDDDVARFFAGADAVVLPYHRSSSSGPIHIAMSRGLPIVTTRVGGLVEATADYEGILLVPPRDPRALSEVLRRLPSLRGKRFADPHSWDTTLRRYEELLRTIGLGARATRESTS